MVSLGSLAGSAHYFSRNLGSSLRCRYIVHHRNEISLLPVFVPSAHSVNPSQRLSAILAREVLFSCVADREISTGTHAYDGRILGAERPSQARLGELFSYSIQKDFRGVFSYLCKVILQRGQLWANSWKNWKSKGSSPTML